MRRGSKRSVTPLAAAMCDACPRRPNPVTSVAQRAPTASAARLADALSLHIEAYSANASSVPRFPCFHCRREERRSERLGQNETIADDGVGVAQNAARVHATSHGQPVLQLFVDDGVTADDERARLVNFFLAAAQNLGEDGDWKFAGWKPDDVHRGHRFAAHREHVGQRIGRGDLTKQEWIVDDRREEIDGLHEREIVGQHKDPRVVEGLTPDNEARIRLEGQTAQRARQVTRTQLRRSARATGERGEAEQLLTRIRRRVRLCAHSNVREFKQTPRERFARRPPHHGTATTASISTSTPRGSADT